MPGCTFLYRVFAQHSVNIIEENVSSVFYTLFFVKVYLSFVFFFFFWRGNREKSYLYLLYHDMKSQNVAYMKKNKPDWLFFVHSRFRLDFSLAHLDQVFIAP